MCCRCCLNCINNMENNQQENSFSINLYTLDTHDNITYSIKFYPLAPFKIKFIPNMNQ